MEGDSGPAKENHNPGNLKDPKTGEFRKFKTEAEGKQALLDQLQSWKTRFPEWTVNDLNKRYAGDKSMGGDNPEGTVSGRDQFLMNQLQ